MSRPASRWGRLASILCNVAMACFFGVFAEAHLRLVRETGEWATVGPLVALELLLVLLFLTRRRSLATSAHPWDWAIGIAGTFLPFFFRAEISAHSWPILGAVLQATGFAVAIAAVVTLGRSIGIIAANRGIKAAGLYRVIRHPMYSGYLLTYAGYIAAYPSAWNALLALSTALAIDQRARAEERFLRDDAGYAELLTRTPWRFLPFLY